MYSLVHYICQAWLFAQFGKGVRKKMSKYDEIQIKRHCKRNAAQNRAIKNMIYQLDLMFGENNSGLFLAMILDALNKMMKEKTPSEFIELRTIEIKFNDFYSVKLDCNTKEYIQ